MFVIRRGFFRRFSSSLVRLCAITSPVVHGRRRFQGGSPTNTYPLSTFIVSAGAVYAYDSELGIDGNAIFTYNSAGEWGGERERPSCIACDEVQVNAAKFGSIVEGNPRRRYTLNVIKKRRSAAAWKSSKDMQMYRQNHQDGKQWKTIDRDCNPLYLSPHNRHSLVQTS